MNQNRPEAKLPDLPATNDKRAQHFLNPDGNAEHYSVTPGKDRYKHVCGELVVQDGFLVCTLSKYPHTLEVKSIDEFIRKNTHLMKALPVKEKVV